MKTSAGLKKYFEGRNSGLLFLMLVLILDMMFLYLMKYQNQNMSLSEFDFYYLGNFLNFLSFFLPITALLGLYLSNSERAPIHIRVFNIYVLLITAFLLLSFILSRKLMLLPKIYIAYYPLQSVAAGLCLVLFQIFLIIFTVLLWLVLLNNSQKNVSKTLRFSFYLISFLVIFSLIYSFDYSDRTQDYLKLKKKADVGVVLGAAVWSNNMPSPIFEARITKAYKLYNLSLVRKLQVTGGGAPGEITEAKAAYNYLTNLGVRPSDILFEESTASTSEQIEYIKRVLTEERRMKKILIISDQFHLKRISEICKFHKLEADGIASGLNLQWDKWLYYKIRDSIALLIFLLFAI